MGIIGEKMKKRVVIIFLFLIIIFIFSYIFSLENNENSYNRAPNMDTDKIVYNSADLIINPWNMEAYIGYSDYVFIGEVVEYLGNYDPINDIPRSSYQILVKENLKGELINNVIVDRYGGYNHNGELEILDCDIEMPFPTIGKQYIFIADARDDGSLLLAPARGNVEYSDNIENKTLREKYISYIANEIVYERPRSISKYDKKAK